MNTDVELSNSYTLLSRFNKVVNQEMPVVKFNPAHLYLFLSFPVPFLR